MKKNTLFIIFFITSLTQLTAQSFNQEIKQEGKSSPHLLGKINKQALSSEPYNQWFLTNQTEYTPKKSTVDSIQNQLSQYTVTIFMGTWCGDSKREVPRFYKILEEADFSLNRITTIAVNNQRTQYKQSPGGEHEGLNIHRVPTFIFYKDGKEVNRIVESPKKTLEEDILDIISGNYSPKYQSVVLIDELLKEKGIDYIYKKNKKIISQLKNKTKSLYELNTYANVLFFSDKKEEALAVLKLNTELFSNEPNTFISLANKHLQMNNIKEAIESYERSLKISKNEEIEIKIQELNNSLNIE
ncbi:thioredoxin family protein [Aquimarina sp. 2201CG5-10]|uniref:thioredoxin family protein n=1 Tax=Aquimarina callyspongiae TaxID=3098150 RepID=UPI002AB4F42D|nr:thioredoxin family protein [Aquimarina sp. 2201CG5-10]MDY8136419.1 thioredoxin family protein [Aquimarina sp. 2201CG5-10]